TTARAQHNGYLLIATGQLHHLPSLRHFPVGAFSPSFTTMSTSSIVVVGVLLLTLALQATVATSQSTFTLSIDIEKVHPLDAAVIREKCYQLQALWSNRTNHDDTQHSNTIVFPSTAPSTQTPLCCRSYHSTG